MPSGAAWPRRDAEVVLRSGAAPFDEAFERDHAAARSHSRVFAGSSVHIDGFAPNKSILISAWEALRSAAYKPSATAEGNLLSAAVALP